MLTSNAVQVNWTMSLGSTCFRMEVQRSKDSLNFQTVYVYPGVCGDADEEIQYDWLDGFAPAYSRLFYRLKLAETEFSEIIALDLGSELANGELILFSNPCGSSCILRLRNPKERSFNLEIIDLQGKITLSESHSGKEELILNTNGWMPGVYILHLTFISGEELKPFKFVVKG